jgi:hypothetical protein
MIKRSERLKNTVNKYMADIRRDRLTTCQSERKSVTKCIYIFFNLVCEAIGTAASPGLLCQSRVIVKMIVEKQSQNPTWPYPGFNPGRRGGKLATNRLSYGAAQVYILLRFVFGALIIESFRKWAYYLCNTCLRIGMSESNCQKTAEEIFMKFKLKSFIKIR